MKNVSTRCAAIAPSPTLEIDAKAVAMREAGINVIGFGAGQPDFDTPQHIKDAAIKAINDGKTKYTPASGILDLKKAVVEKFQRDNGLVYEPSQIVVSNGAKHSLFNAFAAVLNEGDEVIVPAPCWVSYPELIKINGGVPVYVHGPAEQEFKPTAAQMRAALTEKTKAILLNSPNNPCGYAYSREELQEIADLAVEHDLFVISDEIYEYLVYDGAQHCSIASLGEKIKENTIVVNGVSKSYAMTGWRIGYTASALPIAKAMGSLQSHVTSNPNSIAQYASVAALNGPREELAAMVKEFSERRELMVKLINGIDGLSCVPPKGAFYVMMNVTSAFGKSYHGKKIETSDDFCSAALDGVKVALVPGGPFLAEGFCRLSYATSRKNIEEGLARIAQFMSELV